MARFFDLVAMKHVATDELALRLGYKRIFCVGEDVDVAENLQDGSQRRKILMSDNYETITKALKLQEFIGIMQKGSSVSNKTLDALNKSEKVLFVAVSPVTCADPSSRSRQLAKMRSQVRNALRAKTRISLVSMAEDAQGMLSSLQAIEVAAFFGIPEEKAKSAIALLGELV